MKEDLVRKRLEQLGASPTVVSGGMEALVKKWETFAEEVSSGYKLDLDSYLNDVDVRQLIEELLTTVPGLSPTLIKRIHRADEVTKSSTQTSKCVWGDHVARREGWTATKNWWYFVVPRELSDKL
jgi:hypothetical protein